MAEQAEKKFQNLRGSVGGWFKRDSTKNFANSIGVIKRQMETPTKLSSKPTIEEGVDGDKRLVKEGPNKYLYIKMMGQWLKTKLNESDLKASNETSTSTSTDTTTTTTSSPTSTNFNAQYDTGDSADNLEGHSSYLIACKETASTGYQATNTTKYASPDLSNGSKMYTSAGASTVWTPYDLTSSSNPNYHYFSMDGSPKLLFKVDYEGNITGVRSRIPSDLTVSGETLSATSIRLTISGNCEITETVRIYYKTAAAGSFTEVTSAISGGNQVSDHSFTYDLTSLSASTTYNIKVRAENGGTQDTSGTTTDEINITTPSSTPSWGTLNDFTLTAFGLAEGSAVQEYQTVAKTITITNGTAAANSTTVSLVKDSGDALEYEVALSTTGDPGIGGTANSGTGYQSSRSVNLGSGTLYMRFRHRFKLAFVGNDANVSVTFANTNGSLANKTDLDITMVNETGPG
jgi:hypothetical protein